MFIFLKPSSGFKCMQNKNKLLRGSQIALGGGMNSIQDVKNKSKETLVKSMPGKQKGGREPSGKHCYYFRGDRLKQAKS